MGEEILLKAGVHLNLIEIFGSLKRDWKGEKKAMDLEWNLCQIERDFPNGNSQ